METHQKSLMFRQLCATLLEWVTAFLALYFTFPSLLRLTIRAVFTIRDNALINKLWFDENLFRGTFVLIAFLGMYAIVWSAILPVRFVLAKFGIEQQSAASIDDRC